MRAHGPECVGSPAGFSGQAWRAAMSESLRRPRRDSNAVEKVVAVISKGLSGPATVGALAVVVGAPRGVMQLTGAHPAAGAAGALSHVAQGQFLPPCAQPSPSGLARERREAQEGELRLGRVKHPREARAGLRYGRLSCGAHAQPPTRRACSRTQRRAGSAGLCAAVREPRERCGSQFPSRTPLPRRLRC